MKIYLAGSIRDNNLEDIEWREEVIHRLGHLATFINPLGNKEFNQSTGVWTMSGRMSSSKQIVEHDFWSIDHIDAAIFNFNALSDKYPNIGTLIEFGRSTARSILRYSILDPNYTGHENTGMYKLHPFILENCAAIFHTVNECCDFLEGHIGVLTGDSPHFKGIKS